MPCAPLLRFSDRPADSRAEAGEVMSGVLQVVSGIQCGPASQKVFARVYRTSSEHFAVLYPVRAIVTACRPLASLNLKSCSVKPLPDSQLRLSPRSCEGMAVTFQGSDVADWLKAFTEERGSPAGQRRKVSDHRLPLPVLVESEEDAE